MKQAKIGVFGAHRGRMLLYQILEREDARIVAVCDKDEPSLNAVKQHAEELNYEGISFYTDFEDFIKHDMDGVIVANYANEHVPYAVRLLRSGKHVLSECLTMSCMKEAVELIEAVEETGCFYQYAENYCFTPVRLEMKKIYQSGALGELMYAEGEYHHDCSSIWPQITYGERNHWRNLMPSTFYCTHSIGPILYMTGLRPVQVVAFETPNYSFMRNLGTASGTFAIETITLNNGAILKSSHFNLKSARGSNYLLCGTLGGALDTCGNKIKLYVEEPGHNGGGERSEYEPKPEFEEAAKTGHGGGDFFTTYYFIRSILGDEDAKKKAVDVYTAVDMCMPGTLGYKSIVNGNMPIKIPDLRNKEEREAYRNDTFCTFPNIAGDQYVSNNIHENVEIPDSVFEEVYNKWINS